MTTDAQDRADEGEKAGRLPSLEEQTLGLDTAQEARTLRDAKAFYGEAGESGDPPLSAAEPDEKAPPRDAQLPR